MKKEEKRKIPLFWWSVLVTGSLFILFGVWLFVSPLFWKPNLKLEIVDAKVAKVSNGDHIIDADWKVENPSKPVAVAVRSPGGKFFGDLSAWTTSGEKLFAPELILGTKILGKGSSELGRSTQVIPAEHSVEKIYINLQFSRPVRIWEKMMLNVVSRTPFRKLENFLSGYFRQDKIIFSDYYAVET